VAVAAAAVAACLAAIVAAYEGTQDRKVEQHLMGAVKTSSSKALPNLHV
jgi:hypothetical protein